MAHVLAESKRQGLNRVAVTGARRSSKERRMNPADAGSRVGQDSCGCTAGSAVVIGMYLPARYAVASGLVGNIIESVKKPPHVATLR